MPRAKTSKKADTSSKTPKYILVLSDLHVGSTVGVWPPGYECIYGQTPGLNPLQKWMWECWQEGSQWVQDITGGDYILALNGDLIDGKHHRATEIMTSTVDDMVGACIELLQPLASKAKKVYCTLGTEAHSGEAEHGIGRALNAQNRSKWATAFNSVTLDMNGCMVEIMHHITTTGRPWLEASGHSIALNMRRAERSRLGEAAPHVLVRGHRHRHGYFCDGHGLTVVAPSWQGLTRWCWKVIPGAEFEIGFTLLDFSDVDDNKLPRVRTRLYRPDTDPVIKP